VELGQVLAALPAVTDPNVVVGAGGRDDAAVYRIAPDRALVATVDFFTPIVDDPADWGAIAAANAVSDIYAMGAKPLFALSILAFPREKLSAGIVEKVVAAGAEKLQEANTPVVGGHSIDDDEPKFGYAVTGEVHPDKVVTNQGAEPGDALYLTKPLGTGLVATAIKRGLCPAGLQRAAIDTMKTLNKAASEEMLGAGARAATDVTGYGLIGHLLNLGVGADISYSAVPLLAGVEELARKDLFPSGTRRNHAAAKDEVEWEVGEIEQLILCDAQTSGGLLVAVPHHRPFAAGVRIGTVTDGPVRVRA
jgi:selenide,water dikinase